jgi:hypothetical protein
MQQALAERERDRERESELIFPDIISHARYESSSIFFLIKFQWFGDAIPNEFRGMFPQRESKCAQRPG